MDESSGVPISVEGRDRRDVESQWNLIDRENVAFEVETGAATRVLMIRESLRCVCNEVQVRSVDEFLASVST